MHPCLTKQWGVGRFARPHRCLPSVFQQRGTGSNRRLPAHCTADLQAEPSRQKLLAAEGKDTQPRSFDIDADFLKGLVREEIIITKNGKSHIKLAGEMNRHEMANMPQQVKEIPAELSLAPPAGKVKGFYRSRLTKARLLLESAHPSIKEHNSNVVVRTFESAKTIAALLHQYCELMDLVADKDQLAVILQLAKLFQQSGMSSKVLRESNEYNVLVNEFRRHPGLQAGGSPEQKCSLLTCFKASGRWSGQADLRNDVYDELYTECIANVSEGGVDSSWEIEQLQEVVAAVRCNEARMGVAPPPAVSVIHAIAREVRFRNFSECDTAALENLIGSVGKPPRLSRDNSPGIQAQQALLRELAVVCLANLDLLKAQSIAVLFAGADMPRGVHSKFVLAATKQLVVRITEFKRKALMLMLEGYGNLCRVRLNSSSPLAGNEMEFVGAVHQGMEAILKTISRRGLKRHPDPGVLARGVKATKYRSDKFMGLLCEAASARMTNLEEYALKQEEAARMSVEILHACATLDYHPGQAFFNTLDKCIMQCHSNLLKWQSALLLWSLAVLQESNLECFPVLLQDYSSQEAENDILDNQVFQALKYATHERHTRPDESWRPLNMPAAKLNSYREKWNAMTRKNKMSWFQKDVGERLDELGVAYSTEELVEEATASVDIAFSFGSRTAEPVRVAVEVDGPSHYSVNTRQHTGPTRMRDHVMRAQGWAVVNIPFFEYRLDMPCLEKYEYIRSKLAAVGYNINRGYYEAAVAALEGNQREQIEAGRMTLLREPQGVDPDRLLKRRPQWQDPSNPYKAKHVWRGPRREQ